MQDRQTFNPALEQSTTSSTTTSAVRETHVKRCVGGEEEPQHTVYLRLFTTNFKNLFVISYFKGGHIYNLKINMNKNIYSYFHYICSGALNRAMEVGDNIFVQTFKLLLYKYRQNFFLKINFYRVKIYNE